MGGWEAARARIQSLFHFVDTIKYTMVNDSCMAQCPHKFVYVCMCFEGFLFLFFVILYSARMLGENKNEMIQLGCETRNLSPKNLPFSP